MFSLRSGNGILIDNSENLKMVEVLKTIIRIPEIKEIMIATGYWDLKGTALITEELNEFLSRNGASLKILIGKDPSVFAIDLKEKCYKNAKEFPKDYIKIDLNKIEMTDESRQKAVKMLVDYTSDSNSKIEIHVFDNMEKQFFHGKCYIFIGEDAEVGYGITGSSNFTAKGLEGNSELNILETNYNQIAPRSSSNLHKTHRTWFEEKWSTSFDWTKEFILEIKASPVGRYVTESNNKMVLEDNDTDNIKVLTPYDNYIHLLQNQFDDVINYDGRIKVEDYIPHDISFKKFTYQTDAVNQGISILKKHHGFILADVVGLGKTYTALMIAKRFMIEHGFDKPILIITPPAIKPGWIDSIEYFDQDEDSHRLLKPLITLTTIGCLKDDTEDDDDGTDGQGDFDADFIKKDYALIIIDESHRFKNNSTLMYKKLDNLIGSITPQPYVMLLSATPQNNSPYDLRNQIYLFEREPKNSTLTSLGPYGNNLESYFAEKQKRYAEYIKTDKKINGLTVQKTVEERKTDRLNLKTDSEDIRRCVVDSLVIRRTRTDIKDTYPDDLKSQGISFPSIKEPEAIGYEMKGELGKLFDETVNIIAPQVKDVTVDENGNLKLNFGTKAGVDALGYYRYCAIAHLSKVKDRKRHEANNLDVERISRQLSELMEKLLVKRLESSQDAFMESLKNLERYTKNMMDMWDHDRIFICPDLNVNEELNDDNIKKYGSFDKCLDALSKKAKAYNKKRGEDENDGTNHEYRRSDFKSEYITLVKNDLTLIRDLRAKWEKQKEDPKLETFIGSIDKFMDKKRNRNQKLVIFTECLATQNVLVRKIENQDKYKVLSVTAANRKLLKDTIAANFDANYKGTKKDDYQILIATDVLAEGVNLHRSSSLVNYDSPWNATKLMQRLGRINRIGSDAKVIYSYNFYPSHAGDSQINLKNRTYVKLQAFHELFGEDSKIYSKDEKVKSFGQMTKITEDEGSSPLMPFIKELRDYRKSNPEKYSDLLNIKCKTVSFTSDSNSSCHAILTESDKNNDEVRSYLYVSDKDGKVRSVSQIEFFEGLKPLSHNSTVAPDFKTDKKYDGHIELCYAGDKQNEKLSLRSKVRTGRKEMQQAQSRIKALSSKINEDDSYQAMLDDIYNSVADGNLTLVKKILEYDVEEDKEMIKQLHVYTHHKDTASLKHFIGESFIVTEK